jgi:DNA-binding response OmpR family regulator
MLSGNAVLVVDDEAGIRQLAARALAAAGCQSHGAANGREAISVLEHTPIDAVVIDMIMPEKEGVETIIEVKSRWPNLKVIAISGGGRLAPDDFLRLASMVGADATMKKPLNFKEMLVRIDGLLHPVQFS